MLYLYDVFRVLLFIILNLFKSFIVYIFFDVLCFIWIGKKFEKFFFFLISEIVWMIKFVFDSIVLLIKYLCFFDDLFVVV